MSEKENPTPSSSGETSKPVKELFDMKNFPHWLDTDEEDYDNFDEKDKEENPEYFLTDEQVEEIFKQMSDKEKKNFIELREYYEADYRQKGEIRPLSEYIKQIVKWLKPGIPSESQEIQEMLREKLLAKARTKSEMRERGELPETKPKVKRVRPVFMGPATKEEKQEDGSIVIRVLPGEDPYAEIDHEEDIIIDMTGMESASEENPDEESADDLSIVTIDSMTNINKDKVRDLWRQMAETKAKEATIYNQLANMVDDMSPAVIQETIIQTPKPGTNVPPEVEAFLEEIGSAAKFKRILAMGYMVYEEYLEKKDPTYQPLSLRKILKKFNTDSKGMMEIRKGEVYKREEKKMKRMLRTEEKPKIEVKEEIKEEKIQIPGTEEEMLVREEDLYDPEIFSEESGPGADLGDDEVEDVDPSGTSSEQPGYQKSGAKRKREETD